MISETTIDPFSTTTPYENTPSESSTTVVTSDTTIDTISTTTPYETTPSESATTDGTSETTTYTISTTTPYETTPSESATTDGTSETTTDPFSTTTPYETTTSESATTVMISETTTDPFSTTTLYETTTSESATTVMISETTIDPFSTTTPYETTPSESSTTVVTPDTTTDPFSTTTPHETTPSESSTTVVTSDTTTDPFSTTTPYETTPSESATTDVTSETTTHTFPTSTLYETTATSESSTTLVTSATTTDISPSTTPFGSTVTSESATTVETLATTTAISSTSTQYETTSTSGITTTVKTAETTTVNAMTSTSIATTSATETSTTTIKPLINCQNGGTPTENGCYCPPLFTGNECQHIQVEISGEIERTAIAEIEINSEYNPKYNDSSSEEYKSFVLYFKSQMEPYYRDKITNFRNITNVELSEGTTITARKQRMRREIEKNTFKSVNAKHDIVVQIDTNDPNEDYNKVFQSIKESVELIKDCTPTISSCPNFTVIDVQVNKTELSDTEYCLLVTELLPEEYRQFFSPATVQGELKCVTQCHPNHPNPRICKNKGTCEVSKEGPACYCTQSDANWYLGEDCEYQIHKVGFYAGMAVVAVVLVLTVAVLSAKILLNKRKQKRYKDNKEALVNQWIDEDFEWPSQNRSNTTHLVEAYDNPAQSNENVFSMTTTPTRTASSTHPSSHHFDLPQNGISLQYLRNNHPMEMNPPQMYTSSRPQTYNSDV
ncbi:mucin-3A [Silurus meridionalis]|nr:mucin-3A [Silurus meridionalis]